MNASRVLLLGVGGLGPWLVDRLARSSAVRALVAADIDDAALDSARSTMLGLELEGLPSTVSVARVDVMDVDALARLLESTRPDLVLQAASLLPAQRWWELARRDGVGEHLRGAGLGPWLPLQLTLPLRLMEAIERSGVSCTVMNLAYPDVVNAVVSRLGHPAPLGAGNVSLLAAAVRHEIASQHGAPVEDVEVRVCAHYAHLRWAMGGGGAQPADHGVLSVRVRGEQVHPDDSILTRAGAALPWGDRSHPLTAASVVRHVEWWHGPQPVPTHMPGACGQPGGYPVLLGAGTVSIDPPPGYDVQALVDLQVRAQRADGIEAIRDDGTVVLTDAAVEHMTQLCGWCTEEITPDAAAQLAPKLLAALSHVQ